MSENIIQPSTKQPIQEHVAKMDDALLKKYTLNFLGEGGEQIVFGVENHPDIVAKVHKQALNTFLKLSLKNGGSTESVDAETKEVAKRYIDRQKEHYRAFKKYFGKAVLKERVLFMPVPFPVEYLEDDVRAEYETRHPGERYGKAPTMVRFQERLHVDGAIENIAVPEAPVYLETDEFMTLPLYAKLNKLITGASIDAGHVDDIIGGRELIQKDKQLRECVADFVRKAIAYTTEAGQALDLVGEGNIIFFKTDDTWTFQLPDALYPGYGNKIFFACQELLKKGKLDETLSEYEYSDLMNGLAYVRQINTLAQLSRVEERLVLVEKLSESEQEQIFKVIRNKQ